MLLKTTEELNHEITAATDIEDYLLQNRGNMLLQSLPDYLNCLLEQKNISRADIVRSSQLDRSYVYQIFSGEKAPSRDKLIALAFGMKLTQEETQTLLKLSNNRPLYARDVRDSIFLFALEKKMDIASINDLLYDHDLKLIGSQE